MSFREGERRIRKDNSAEIFGVVRHLELNLLKEERAINEVSRENAIKLLLISGMQERTFTTLLTGRVFMQLPWQ